MLRESDRLDHFNIQLDLNFILTKLLEIIYLQQDCFLHICLYPAYLISW